MDVANPLIAYLLACLLWPVCSFLSLPPFFLRLQSQFFHLPFSNHFVFFATHFPTMASSGPGALPSAKPKRPVTVPPALRNLVRGDLLSYRRRLAPILEWPEPSERDQVDPEPVPSEEQPAADSSTVQHASCTLEASATQSTSSAAVGEAPASVWVMPNHFGAMPIASGSRLDSIPGLHKVPASGESGINIVINPFDIMVDQEKPPPRWRCDTCKRTQPDASS